MTTKKPKKLKKTMLDVLNEQDKRDIEEDYHLAMARIKQLESQVYELEKELDIADGTIFELQCEVDRLEQQIDEMRDYD